eukprot:1646701-Amphidinium_carterae.1
MKPDGSWFAILEALGCEFWPASSALSAISRPKSSPSQLVTKCNSWKQFEGRQEELAIMYHASRQNERVLEVLFGVKVWLHHVSMVELTNVKLDKRRAPSGTSQDNSMFD